MDSSETSALEDEPKGERADAELLYQFALQTFDNIGYEKATAAERAAQAPSERLAIAQLLVLQAIYHELRHGSHHPVHGADRFRQASTAWREFSAGYDQAPDAEKPAPGKSLRYGGLI
ncbi:hypothetical protein ABT294_38995 [Nonomuraea sp. NPDC000554]|uniref:hypothetical protein n=1 Tax=Nonomuraea sp. NPDC000554 TaxID=3154259 RepID=UPI00332682FA